MAKLTGAELEALSRLLNSALSEFDLDAIVYTSTGDQLYDVFIPRDLPKLKAIRQLLIELESAGLTSIVLKEIYARREHRADVRAEIARLFPEAATPEADTTQLSLQRGGVEVADAPARAAAPGLQRNVRPNLAKLDIQVWVERLMQIERRVCRIELDGRAAGTGFLVGPQAVLTNWHVVEGASKAGTLSRLACRFDYLRLPDASRQMGIELKLHEDAVLDSRPYAPAEATKTPDSPPPGQDELDYALLRLADPTDRGCITLPAQSAGLKPGDPLLIVQHPDGAPMKLAMDTDAVIGAMHGGLRIRYRTNTDPGASGSPAFTMDWDLAALHHFGDPAWQAPVFNQGVPAELIRASITQRGHAAWLGG